MEYSYKTFRIYGVCMKQDIGNAAESCALIKVIKYIFHPNLYSLPHLTAPTLYEEISSKIKFMRYTGRGFLYW